MGNKMTTGDKMPVLSMDKGQEQINPNNGRIADNTELVEGPKHEIDVQPIKHRYRVEENPSLPFVCGELPILGSGGYGVVVKTKNRQGKPIAVKIFRGSNQLDLDSFRRERDFYEKMKRKEEEGCMMNWLPRYEGSGVLLDVHGSCPWCGLI